MDQLVNWIWGEGGKYFVKMEEVGEISQSSLAVPAHQRHDPCAFRRCGIFWRRGFWYKWGGGEVGLFPALHLSLDEQC